MNDPDERDVFDHLRAVVTAAGKVDRSTQLQIHLLLQRALERAVETLEEGGR